MQLREFPFSGTLWCLAVWAVMHMAGGTVGIPEDSGLLDEHATKPVLYGVRLHPWTPRYDQIVHAFDPASPTDLTHFKVERMLGEGGFAWGVNKRT